MRVWLKVLWALAVWCWVFRSLNVWRGVQWLSQVSRVHRMRARSRGARVLHTLCASHRPDHFWSWLES